MFDVGYFNSQLWINQELVSKNYEPVYCKQSKQLNTMRRERTPSSKIDLLQQLCQDQKRDNEAGRSLILTSTAPDAIFDEFLHTKDFRSTYYELRNLVLARLVDHQLPPLIRRFNSSLLQKIGLGIYSAQTNDVVLSSDRTFRFYQALYANPSIDPQGKKRGGIIKQRFGLTSLDGITVADAIKLPVLNSGRKKNPDLELVEVTGSQNRAYMPHKIRGIETAGRKNPEWFNGSFYHFVMPLRSPLLHSKKHRQVGYSSLPFSFGEFLDFTKFVAREYRPSQQEPTLYEIKNQFVVPGREKSE